jgi:biopolymer transport protein ExbD
MNCSKDKIRNKSHLRIKNLPTSIDLTAMVDLGFLLITFFMMGTFLSKPKRIELNMPDRPDKTRQSVSCFIGSRPLYILLGEKDKVYAYSERDYDYEKNILSVDSTNFSKEGIRATILRKQAEVAAQWGNKDGLLILIKSMPKARYKNLIDILDEMAITSVKRYAIVETDYYDKAIMKAVGASEL